MDTDGRMPDQIAPNEATLDAPSSSASSGLTGTEAPSHLSAGPGFRRAPTDLHHGVATNGSEPCVNIVEGSGPGMSSETRAVLRSRLRASALLMYAGFTAFWLWWTWEILFAGRVMTAGAWIVYGAQIAVAVVIGLLGVGMCRKCDIPLWSLRIQETVIFGLPAVFFVLMQAVSIPNCAQMHNFVPTPIVPWLMLIFLYALFIPNTWKRAALIIGAMALAPIVVTGALWWTDSLCREVLAAQQGFFPEMVIELSLAAVASVVGVHTIGTLRWEAFRAKQLGQYNLRYLIGAGGMGEVYLGEHRLMKRPCAIKLIRPDKAGDPKILARFEREVKATAKLSHWNSIEIFDYGHAEDGTFYYVMEYLPGMNLQELVTRYGPLAPARVIHLITQTCDALSEAHAAGMVHRDIKPANIFAAQRGGLYDVAKLLDFGLVKPLSTIGNPQLTQEGSITGSPLYMSPEQSTGDTDPDARSDIYSVGAVAYFLLTGRPPFNYEQPIKVLLAHSREIPVAPSEIEPDIRADLESVVMKCLEKNPDDRFQDVLQLRDALLNCEDAGHWTRRLAERWWQSNNETSKAIAEPSTMAAGRSATAGKV